LSGTLKFGLLSQIDLRMPLDRQAKRILGMLAAGGMEPRSRDLSALKLREAMQSLQQAFDVQGVAISSVENRNLPRAGGALAVRIYTPAAIDSQQQSAALIYFHGGAGVFCSIATHEGLCRMLANASGCRVFSIDYRHAPEHPFPAAIEDAYFATQWLSSHAREFGIDPARLAIGGDSFGGTLAAFVCQHAKETRGPALSLQVLICPVTDLSRRSESWATYGTGYLLERETLDWAIEHYAPQMDLADPRISPLRALDLTGLPPAHIHTAEFDPVRDEGTAYAEALGAAGVPVRYTCHAGMIHHFYCMAGAITYAQQAIKDLGAAIAEALAIR
jgi:acetyl esterase